MRPFRFPDLTVTLDGVLGFGTPVGMAGVAVQYDPLSALSVGAGVGTNFSGPQLAALLRLRPFVWERSKRALAIELGGAFSAGKYGGQIADLGELAGEGGTALPAGAQSYLLDWTYWAQVEVGFEMKTRSGLHLLVAQGVAVPLNADQGTCKTIGDGAPAACDKRLIHDDAYPVTVPLVITVMVGWSL